MTLRLKRLKRGKLKLNHLKSTNSIQTCSCDHSKTLNPKTLIILSGCTKHFFPNLKPESFWGAQRKWGRPPGRTQRTPPDIVAGRVAICCWSSFVMETFGKVDIYGLDPTRVSLIMAHCRIRKGGVWMFQNYYVFFEIYLVNFWCLRTIMFFSEIYSWEMFAWFDPLVYLKIFTVTWFAKCCCHVKHIPDVMPFCQSHICQVNGMHGKDNTP